MKKCLTDWKILSNRNVTSSHKERTMTNNVTAPKETAVVIDDELRSLQSMGAENVTSANVLIPRLTILQGLSPQINRKKAEYIEGSEVGDFCNVATGDLYKDQILVVPCHFATAYIEWTKNRGGLAANHGDDPSILKKCMRNERNENVLPNGNIVQETAQWYCLLQDGHSWNRIFFPLKATNLKHSKKWMTLVMTEAVEMPDKTIWKPPLFWRSWHLIIIDDSNDQGDWATFRPEKGEKILDLDPDRRLLRMCKSFYEDIKKNIVRPDLETQQDEGRPSTIDGTTAKDPTKADIPF